MEEAAVEAVKIFKKKRTGKNLRKRNSNEAPEPDKTLVAAKKKAKTNLNSFSVCFFTGLLSKRGNQLILSF
jgi:hypothetical protein